MGISTAANCNQDFVEYPSEPFPYVAWTDVGNWLFDFSGYITISDISATWSIALGSVTLSSLTNEMSELKVCEIADAATDLVDQTWTEQMV